MSEVEYKIEITMLPHYWDNEFEPYFWLILVWDDIAKDWVCFMSGWAKTPNESWEVANKKYNEIINK